MANLQGSALKKYFGINNTCLSLYNTMILISQKYYANRDLLDEFGIDACPNREVGKTSQESQ